MEDKIRLSSQDSSILARVAQYGHLDETRRLKLLEGASPEAQKIGRVIIGMKVEDATPEMLDIAREFSVWAEQNRAYARSRVAVGAG